MSGRLAFVTGSGAIVPEAIAAARANGWEVLLFDVVGRDDLDGEAATPISVDEPTALVAALQGSGASHLCAVGGLELNERQRAGLAQALGLLGGARGLGDSAMTEGYRRLAQGGAMSVVGVDEFAPELLAPSGHFGGPAESLPPKDLAERAMAAARAVGALDLGQAVVASAGRVIAAEGVEGTAGLLERAGEYVRAGLVDVSGGPLVLAKCLRPNQPRYLDLPAIGPETVVAAAEAAISAIVVEAGGSLLIERERMKAVAAEKSVALLGLAVDG